MFFSVWAREQFFDVMWRGNNFLLHGTNFPTFGWEQYDVFAASASKNQYLLAPQAKICTNRNLAIRKCKPNLIQIDHQSQELKSEAYARKCTILCFPWRRNNFWGNNIEHFGGEGTKKHYDALELARNRLQKRKWNKTIRNFEKKRQFQRQKTPWGSLD